MTPSKWLRRHGFVRRGPPSSDSCWERADATLIRSGPLGRWVCRYKDVVMHGPHEGLRVPGAVGFGKRPWIAMSRCHQEQAWRLAHPDQVRRSGRTTKKLRECLEYLRNGFRDVVLVGAHAQHAHALRKQLEQLAEQEGVSLSGVTIRTVSVDADLRWCTAPVFKDHYATETFWERRVGEWTEPKVSYEPWVKAPK